jgi:TRAP-type mannitol/chloroaromatic compound transport system substrate-binding protein
LAAPAIAQSTNILFSMVTDRPQQANELSRLLSLASGGRLEIVIETRATGERGVFLDLVGSGERDIYLASEDAFANTDPAFGLFGSMPLGMTTDEMQGWLIVDRGQALWDNLAADYGVKTFAAGDDGPQALWSKEPLQSLADLRNARVASSGLGIQTLNVIGVDAVNFLRPGVDLDSLTAIEGVTVPQMMGIGLFKTYPHMITPNGNRPMSQHSVGVNLLLWHALSDEDQFLVSRVLAAHHAQVRSRAEHRNAQGLKTLGAKVVQHTMPDDIWAEQAKAARGLVLRIGSERPTLMDSYSYYLADVTRWSEIGQAQFVEGRRQALAKAR